MYDSAKVAESIKNRAKERNVQIKDMLLDLNLNKNKFIRTRTMKGCNFYKITAFFVQIFR